MQKRVSVTTSRELPVPDQNMAKEAAEMSERNKPLFGISAQVPTRKAAPKLSHYGLRLKCNLPFYFCCLKKWYYSPVTISTERISKNKSENPTDF